MGVVLTGGVTMAAVSTSGKCNAFDDARAVSSSISAADQENKRAPVPQVVPEGRGVAQVPWLPQDQLGGLHCKEGWLRRPLA